MSKRASLGAALVAAATASSCCLGPLVLGALGLGGAASFAWLAAYRPALLALTAGLLGVGFYLAYRTPKASADACGCDRPASRRGPRALLWALTFFAALLAASPPLLARLSDGGHRLGAHGPLAQATLRVAGVDCEACAVPIRKALAEAGGFDEVRLDVPARLVVLSYEPGPGRPEAYLRALEGLGYEPSLVEQGRP